MSLIFLLFAVPIFRCKSATFDENAPIISSCLCGHVGQLPQHCMNFEVNFLFVIERQDDNIIIFFLISDNGILRNFQYVRRQFFKCYQMPFYMCIDFSKKNLWCQLYYVKNCFLLLLLSNIMLMGLTKI